MIKPLRFVFFLLVLFFSACPSRPENQEEGLVQRGRSVYRAQCVSCHAPNPKLDGSIGPAVYGSSHELVEARVLYATYPEGYAPKRPSKNMTPLPHLSNEIDALTAFLQAQ